MTRADAVWCADELRLGLRGVTRRVLAPRGVKVRQPIQLKYEWRYLLLAVEPRGGRLVWRGIARMRQEELAPVRAAWSLDAVVWDGASCHTGGELGDLATARAVLPPASPERNPAERVFEEVRARVEGRVYPTLEAKQAAADAYRAELAADPARVRRLCGWRWLIAALADLPAPAAQAA